MDKEKFYNAMVKRFGCSPALTDYSSSAKNDISLAKALDLIPDDDVVLTEEQFSKLRQTIINLSQEHTKKCNEMNDKIINARKQAVKEFIERLKEEKQLIDLGCGAGCYDYIDIDDIDEIAKDFGVEL